MEDFCSLCKFRNADTMAIKYCITCQEPQCKACYSVHKSSKATRKHLMVDISDVNKNSKIDQDLESLQKCAEHKKELEFYCTDHKHLLCSTCLLQTNGLECKAIVEISSAGELLANSMFNNQIKTDLDSVLVHCIEENRKIQSLIQSGKNERIDIQRQFQHIKQKVAMVLEKYEIRVLEEVDHNIETQLMELNQHLATLSDTLNTAKDNKAKLQTVVENGSKADIFRCTLSISEQLDDLRVSNIADKATVYKHSLKMSTALSFLVRDTYPFPVVKCETIKYSREYPKSLNISDRKQKLSNIVEQVMLKTDRNKLPDFVHCDADTKESGDGIIKDGDTELKSVMFDEQRQAEDKTALVTNALETGCSQTNIRIAHVSNIRINTTDDRLPTIDGVTTLHDGRLILSDQNAPRLIILKENFTYDHELDFKEPPGNLTVLTPESLAVCLPTAKTVTIISTDAFTSWNLCY
ncbi:uncharacterized protein LOC123548068 [Mercenaria mercenaria]|uniref:uncharacterized protein LOC123548068 n=1 Tax=Mercenaria mercenaria TaxID=6596 RepID=UPI00234EEF28|nr:uncharacterized protein LOC123548068 [Mercenaria mercenaria]